MPLAESSTLLLCCRALSLMIIPRRLPLDYYLLTFGDGQWFVCRYYWHSHRNEPAVFSNHSIELNPMATVDLSQLSDMEYESEELTP